MEQHHPLAMVLALVIVLAIAYFSARKPRQRPAGERQGLSAKELRAIMKQRAQDAVQTGQQEHGKKLDLSPESVQLVEEILAALHERHLASPFDSGQLTQEATKWGAYLGEALKKVYPSEWRQDSEQGGPWSLPLIEQGGKFEVFPVGWVRQRIVDGAEHNVWARFCFFVDERVQASS